MDQNFRAVGSLDAHRVFGLRHGAHRAGNRRVHRLAAGNQTAAIAQNPRREHAVTDLLQRDDLTVHGLQQNASGLRGSGRLGLLFQKIK